jgi:hypothetical protein
MADSSLLIEAQKPEVKISEVKIISEKEVSPKEVDKKSLIVFLNWFGNIKSGQDIFVNKEKDSENYIFTPSFFSIHVWSYLSQEVKDNNISFIKKKVEDSLAYLNELIKTKSKKSKQSEVYQSLIKASMGLENLKKNYKNDSLFCCKLENVIESIKNTISASD